MNWKEWTVILTIGVALMALAIAANWADIESCKDAGGVRKCFTGSGIGTGVGSNGAVTTTVVTTTTCVCYLPDGSVK